MGEQMSGQAIYESLVNTDASGLLRSGLATEKLSRNYQVRAEALAHVATVARHSWEGAAASAAQRRALPLATRHELTVPQLDTAVMSIRQQVEALNAARHSVVPVPPMPEQPGFFDNLFSLGGASRDHETRVAAVQSANDHNVAVMTRYEQATRRNAALLHQIPTALGSLPPLGDAQIQELPRSGAPVQSPVTGPPSPAGRPPGPTGASPGEAGTTSRPRQPSPAESPTTDDFAHTRATSFHTAPSGVAASEFGQPKPVPAPTPDAARHGLPFGPLGVGPGAGAEPTRGGVPGKARGSGAFGWPRGAGAGYLGEPGARGGSGGGIGTRGSASVAEPIGRGAAGRGGGTLGAGGPAGRRGGSEDDLEHQRAAFLVEADPDELFGNDVVTAPPVIGG